MKLRCFINIIFIFSILIPGVACSQSINKSDKRFLGFHFDFHAKKDDKEIGKNVDQASIDQFLNLINPDYVQVDTKGVYGISSYPTKVGFTSTSYETDVLRIWRDLTAKYGVSLYSHYTTIMDEEAATRFPDWARMKNDNSKDKTKVSIFSDYAEDLFIPQVKEFISEYGLDGIWVDADSWALEPEYGSRVRNRLSSQTSLDNIPPGDNPNYKKYIEFLRNEYVSYAKNYVNKIHSYDPDFKIGINWAYSKMMPEPIEIDVDYLSADMSGKNWIYDAAFDSRVFASYDKPWDLMSWSFYDKGIKPEKLLFLEAAEVLSMGGGYQSYWFQMRNGGFDKSNLTLMKKLADFCRAREPFCFETKIIPQVGVFFSRETWAEKTGSVYNGGGNDNIQGVTSLLLDAGASVQILMEQDLNDLSLYPFVVIPESDIMSPSIKNKFTNYVNNGGRLLIIGNKATEIFKNDLNVSFNEHFVYKKYALKNNNGAQVFDLPYAQVQPGSGTDVLMNTYLAENNSKIYSPFLTSRRLGSGVISGIYSDLGSFYHTNESDLLVNSFREILKEIFPGQTVRSLSDEKIHITLSEKNGQKLIQLVNVQHLKPFMNAEYYGALTPAKNIRLNIKSPVKPSRLVLQPENRDLNFTYSNGTIDITLDNLDVYSILQIVN